MFSLWVMWQVGRGKDTRNCSYVCPHRLGFGPAVPAKDSTPWSIVGSMLRLGWGCRRNDKLNSGWAEGDGRCHSTDFSTQLNSSGQWEGLEVAIGQGTSRSHAAAHRAPHVQLSSLPSRMRNLLIPSKDATPKSWLPTPPVPQTHMSLCSPHLSPVTFLEALRSPSCMRDRHLLSLARSFLLSLAQI